MSRDWQLFGTGLILAAAPLVAWMRIRLIDRYRSRHPR